MNFLPIVTREIRVAARRPETYWVRIGAAGAGLLVAFLALIVGGAGAGSLPAGQVLFQGVSAIMLVVCLLEGARSTSDALSEEKRAGTLGLLFLTDLKGYDVVLGKLFATSLRTLYALVGLVPVLALAIPFGGINFGEVCRMALVMFNLLLLSLSIGLAVSAFARQSRWTLGVTLGLLTVIGLAPYGLAGAVNAAAGSSWAPQVRDLSPFAAFGAVGELAFQAAPQTFWRSLLAGQAVVWLSLGLAAWATPRTWRESPRQARARSRRIRPREVVKRQRLLDTRPVAWLFQRSVDGRWTLAVTLVLGVALIAVTAASGQPSEALYPIAVMAGLVIKVGVATAAAQALAEIRQSGLLEPLLATPVGGREIVEGHWRSALTRWLGPVLLLGAVYAVLMVGLSWRVAMGARDEWVLLGMLLLDSLSHLCDLAALFWTASWFGFSSGKGNASAIKAVLLVHVLPSFLCCGLRALSDVVFWIWALGRLRKDFRRCAAEPSPNRG